MSDHLFRLWHQAWEKHRQHLKHPASKWVKKEWREPFELLGAALIYNSNALKCMPEGALHLKVRTAISSPQGAWNLLNEREPDFCQNTEGEIKGLFAPMYLASSSFRLSTALFLIYKEILNQVPGILLQFLKTGLSDWDRKKLENPLKNTKDLKCCLQGKSPDEKVALAMIMAHRDEFAHGEEGKGESWWFRHRSEYSEKFYVCQIFQAQLILAKLASDELSRIK